MVGTDLPVDVSGEGRWPMEVNSNQWNDPRALNSKLKLKMGFLGARPDWKNVEGRRRTADICVPSYVNRKWTVN